MNTISGVRADPAIDSHPAMSGRLLTLGLCLAAAGVPLAWSNLVAAEYTLPRLMLLCASLLCACIGLALSLRAGMRPAPAAAGRPAAAGLLALLAAALASSDPRLSLLGQYNNYTYGVWAASLYAAAFFLCSWTPEREKRRVLDAALIGGLAVSAYALLQAAGIEPFNLSAKLPTGRAVSTIGSPVHLGAYLAMLLPLALHRALDAGRGRLLGILCVPFFCLAIWATLTRGAWLAALAGTAFFLAFRENAQAGIPGRLRIPVLILLIALLLLPGASLFLRSASASDIGRVEGWKAAWSAFLAKPLLGHGPDTFTHISRKSRSKAFIRAMGPTAHHADAHNDVLQALSTTGLLGTLAYLWLLAALALEAARSLKDPARMGEAAAVSGGLLALFLTMKLNPVSLELMAAAALLAGALSGQRGAQARPLRRPGARSPLRPGPACAALLLLCLLSTALCARLLAADRHVQLARLAMGGGDARGALSHLRSGLDLNACELKYRIIHVNLLVDLARRELAAGDRAGAESRLEGAAVSVAEAARCHPADVNSHYLLGYVSLVQAQVGLRERLSVAESALDRALDLDPDFGSILQLRLEAATLRGDRAKAAEIQGRLKRADP